MLFIGPNDLASSMGYVAFDHASIPEVQEASTRILKATLDAGKYAGHFALSADAGKCTQACAYCAADCYSPRVSGFSCEAVQTGFPLRKLWCRHRGNNSMDVQ